MSQNTKSRRAFLQSIAAVTVASAIPMPLLASINSPNILVWVTLRGGMDGLNVVAPVSDPLYQKARPTLGLREDQVQPLDWQFGLHPAMSHVYPWYRQKELAFVHACSTPYSKRSHFDGQKVLENGTNDPLNGSGWLNRLISISGNKNQGVAIDTGLPLIMQGSETIPSWYPNKLKTEDEKAALLTQLFQGDQVLSSHYESIQQLNNSIGKQGIGKQFTALCSQTGELLSAQGSPNVAALEFSGWDTHNNQSGKLASQLQILDEGLFNLKAALGQNWNRTLVMVASEFGRRVSENGTNGTDHGVGGVVMLAGGSLDKLGITRSKVYGNWPGLSDNALFQGRDLQATTDIRSVIKTALHKHLMISLADIEHVFPQSSVITPMHFS